MSELHSDLPRGAGGPVNCPPTSFSTINQALTSRSILCLCSLRVRGQEQVNKYPCPWRMTAAALEAREEPAAAINDSRRIFELIVGGAVKAFGAVVGREDIDARDDQVSRYFRTDMNADRV